MSARSSRPRSAAIAAAAIAAAASGCSHRDPGGDPAAIAQLARDMIAGIPGLGFTECANAQILGGATLTMRTAFQIAGKAIPDRPEFQEYVAPPELDVPAARVLVDPSASASAKRRAAAELATAPFFLIYIVDAVDVPMALGIKELTRGSVSNRALRYSRTGQLECVRVFMYANDAALSAEVIAKSVQPKIDPAVAKRLQDDLRVQALRRVAALNLPPPRAPIPPKPRIDDPAL
jgi:hypothetical protein